MFVESQNGGGVKIPLGIESSPLLTAGSARAGCSGPCPKGSMETAWTLWSSYYSAWPPSLWKAVSLYLIGIVCISIFAHCLLSYHWESMAGSLWLLFGYLYVWIRSPQTSYSPGWTWPALCLSFHARCSSVFTTFMALGQTHSSGSMSVLMRLCFSGKEDFPWRIRFSKLYPVGNVWWAPPPLTGAMDEWFGALLRARDSVWALTVNIVVSCFQVICQQTSAFRGLKIKGSQLWEYLSLLCAPGTALLRCA